MESVRCNLCGSADSHAIIVDLPDLLLDRKDILTTFVKCNRCGLEYQTPRPDPVEILQHYSDDYEKWIDAERPGRYRNWISNVLANYGVSKKTRLVRRYIKKGRMLDIGCGTGAFLHAMGQLPGWEPFGVEINDHAAGIARRQYRLPVQTGTLEQAHFPAGFFDAVTLWDVFEHLPDPMSSLGEIARILKPEGLVILQVPNGESRDRFIFGADWVGWEAPRHFFVFNPLTLSRFLEKQNFAVVGRHLKQGGYLPILHSLQFRWTRQGMLKNRGKWLQLLRSPGARLFTAPIFAIRGLFQPGTEMVVVARKL